MITLHLHPFYPVTVLEAYDYDVGKFVIEEEWPFDCFEEQCEKLGPTFTDTAKDCQTWRLSFWEKGTCHKAKYLSRAEDF